MRMSFSLSPLPPFLGVVGRNNKDYKGSLGVILPRSRSLCCIVFLPELGKDDGEDEYHEDCDDGDGDHPICSHPTLRGREGVSQLSFV